jgi:hypothetical protein
MGQFCNIFERRFWFECLRAQLWRTLDNLTHIMLNFSFGVVCKTLPRVLSGVPGRPMYVGIQPRYLGSSKKVRSGLHLMKRLWCSGYKVGRWWSRFQVLAGNGLTDPRRKKTFFSVFLSWKHRIHMYIHMYVVLELPRGSLFTYVAKTYLHM